MLFKIFERKHKTIYDTSKTEGTRGQQQPTVDSMLAPKKYATTDSRQSRANDALTLLVYVMILHPSVVEAPFFNLFTETLDPRFVVPS